MVLLIPIILIIVFSSFLGRLVLRGSKDEQLQELERIKSNSGGFGGGL